MPERIKQKWRPPLALVIGGTLAVVLFLPVIGIGYLRLAGSILGWLETAQLFGFMALIATLILGFLLWRLVLHPVNALTAHANALKSGRDDTPLPDHFGTPEITTLAKAVHEMGTTLQDREAGLRAYSDHVTHELKSPLTSLIAAAELLEGAGDEDRAQLVKTVRASAQTLQGQLEALRRLAFAREPVGPGPAYLSEVVGRLQAGIEVALDGNAIVPMDGEALAAVLGHLAQNAEAHGADRLNISGNGQSIIVHDNGRGIAPGNRARVFDPFFTTRRGAGGTGMGLAIVRTMLQAAGGEIRLIPPGSGPAGVSATGAAFEISF